MFDLFATFLIWVVRGWCTRRKRVRVIERECRNHNPQQWPFCLHCVGTGREPYLIRYALFGWLPGDKRRAAWLPNVYLHNILLPDSDLACHNHPWPWAWSLILKGWYLEESLRYFDSEEIEIPHNVLHTRQSVGVQHCAAGQVNHLRGNTFHRIDDVSPGGMWSLFVTSGGERSSWGFAVPGQGFVGHRERRVCYGMPEIDENENWVVRDPFGRRL